MDDELDYDDYLDLCQMSEEIAQEDAASRRGRRIRRDSKARKKQAAAFAANPNQNYPGEPEEEAQVRKA